MSLCSCDGPPHTYNPSWCVGGLVPVRGGGIPGVRDPFPTTMRATLPWGHHEAQVKAEQERLAMQLAAVVGAASMDTAASEVERRERLFNHLRHTTISGGNVHPRTAALESVLHDATKGYL